MIEYLFATKPAGVVAGDLNCHFWKVSSNKLLEQLIRYIYIVTEPYVQDLSLEEFSAKIT